MLSTRNRALGLCVAAILVAAACGGDDDGGGASSDTPATVEDPSTGDTGDTGDTGGTGGSSASSDASASAEPQCEETVPGSEVTYSELATTGELDPTLIAGGVVGGTEAAAIYDTLFTYDYETNEVVPHLAKGITSNDDFTEFTLELREGITYSDGTPLDAQMVAENIDRYFADHAIAPQAAFLARIESKQVVNPTTLEITMKGPWAEFPTFLAEQVGMIVNTNAVGDDVNAFAADPPDAAGVGPYVLERNAPNEEIVLTARDDYWGGPVCIETLRIVAGQGGAQAYDTFKAGEADVVYLRDPATVQTAIDEGAQHNFIPVDLGLVLHVNHIDGYAGNDPRLREAIWRAIDPEVVNQRAFQGTFNTSMSLIHPDSVWGSDDLATVEYDPERAQQLVEEATADGLSAELEILSASRPTSAETALAYEGMLEAVGFDVTVEQTPINDVVARTFAGNFDTASASLDIELAQIATRLHGYLHSTGVNNRGKYESAEMDAAVTEALAASGEEREAAIARINDLYVEDFVAPNLGNIETGIIWQDHVEGITINPTVIYLFHDAWVEE